MRRPILAVPLILSVAAFAAENKPVAVVAAQMLQIKAPSGKQATLPLYVSVDWTKPQPLIVRALVVFHGKQRNADDYHRSGLGAREAAGAAGKNTIVITPQFLEDVDIRTHSLGRDTLRWNPEGWMAGEDAIAPEPISSYDAVDAIVAKLADKQIFPHLQTVVLAGHSGGGQVLERYAVVGKAAASLERRGMHVRFVVANPSSYLYFNNLRPRQDGTYTVPDKTCFGKFNRWKYGTEDPPRYVGSASFSDLEKQFVAKDVIFLLGTADTDPDHPALDKSCSAELQGPFRYARGMAFFDYMKARNPDTKHQLWSVSGVGHDGEGMFRSSCGVAALFDSGTCTTKGAMAPKLTKPGSPDSPSRW